jgi:hypothetical protein
MKSLLKGKNGKMGSRKETRGGKRKILKIHIGLGLHS